MARRTPVERWLEQCLCDDKTRPNLAMPAISSDDPNLRVCTDEHRMHKATAELYTKPITNDWKPPTDSVFNVKGKFQISKMFSRNWLVNEIDKQLDETLNTRLIEEIKEMNDAAELFKAMKTESKRENFEKSIKQTLSTLREFRNPRSAVSLEAFIGVNVHLNASYLLEALNYDPQFDKLVTLNTEGGELDPVIIKYVYVNLAAVIMPMRH